MTSATGIPIGRKLGKLPPRHDVRTFQLIDYLHRPLLPPAPVERDWFDKLPADLGMMGNDRYGNCGFVGLAHAIQTWTSQNGLAITPTDDEINSWYHECTGFDPNDPSTDNGVVLLDALNYFRKKGLIEAFMKVDHHNVAHRHIATNLFGGIYTGARLPLSAQDTSKPWTGVDAGRLTGDNEPDSWGGHCMWSAQFTPAGSTFATWAERQFADNQWNLDYVDEAYVLLSKRWADEDHPAPVGFDLKALRADLAAL